MEACCHLPYKPWQRTVVARLQFSPLTVWKDKSQFSKSNFLSLLWDSWKWALWLQNIPELCHSSEKKHCYLLWLGYRSTLTEIHLSPNTYILEEFMLDSKRTYPNSVVFWLFSRSLLHPAPPASQECTSISKGLGGLVTVFSSSPRAVQEEHAPSIAPCRAEGGWHQPLHSLPSSQSFTRNWKIKRGHLEEVKTDQHGGKKKVSICRCFWLSSYHCLDLLSPFFLLYLIRDWSFTQKRET